MKKLAISIFVMLSSHYSSAKNVPNTGILYRVDTRSDSIIFSTGFLPLGDNNSVREHSRGASCIGRQANSMFVSVSTDPIYAGNYARRLVALGHHTVYVYTITSTANFYNMRTSLSEAGYTAGTENAATQSEWISIGQIDATTIQGVRRYTGETTPPIINNPTYIPQLSFINYEPYRRPVMESDLPGTEIILASINPRATTCMAATLNCFNPQSRELVKCSYIESYKENTTLIYSDFIF